MLARAYQATAEAMLNESGPCLLGYTHLVARLLGLDRSSCSATQMMAAASVGPCHSDAVGRLLRAHHKLVSQWRQASCVF
ncbi:unnamed protein product [Protopolystoma xenopodis]|uniref:Uncharacterized protein n=1 Tax=Protopolystoma xenopodis TaxID=117903 RepID=A0A448XCU3_9PLAT|nr:unnamed protein product [Protopolystoma xenopodis]